MTEYSKYIFLENLRQRLERVPMLKVLVPLVAGILLADVVTLPLWGVAIGFVVCAGMGVALRRKGVADLYIVVAIVLAGVMGAEVRRSFASLPSEYTTMEIVVENITAKREHTTHADGHLVAYATAQGSRRSRAEVRLSVSPEVEISRGDRLLVESALRPFAEEESYGRYMLARGVAGTVYVSKENLLQHTHHPPLGARLHSVAVERLQRLGLAPANQAVVMAMSIAERSGITPSLRRSYSLGGAAHLLAVSGLHIGFVCVMANLLLTGLLLLRHGQVVRSILVVILIWLFAAIAGFTPSIVRAAVMFSVLQLSLLLASRTDVLNTLCFTAFAMLAWDARVLHDAGFQLSFIAVAAIVEWGIPLISKNHRRPLARVTHWLLSAVVVSAVAALASLPLTAYLFGTVSLWSVVTGTIMIVLSAVTVGVAMLWILCPLGVLQGAAAWLLTDATNAMNALAEWCATQGLLAAEVSVDGWICWGVYGVMVTATIIVWATRRRN